MGLKKSGVRKGNSRLQDSGLFGIIDNVIPTNHVEKTTAKFPVSLNYQARKLALSSVLRAEYFKAQAITMIRKMSIR